MSEEYPISLYLSMAQGDHADLRVISQAGVAFANLVEQTAKLLDPFGDVRVEIVSGSEGSFDFNAIIKPVQNIYAGIKAGIEKRPALKWVVVYVAFRIINHSFDWSQDKVMDWLSSSDAPAAVKNLTLAEQHSLASEIVKQMRPEFAKEATESLYAAVRRDNKITGVGVSSIAKKIPDIIVPQSEFADRSGSAAREEGEWRTRTERMDVILVSPILMESNRRWKFQGAHGEFGAPMMDKLFLGDALSGRAEMKLQQGLHMDVDVEISEMSRDGVWQPQHRTITHVWGWKEPPSQGGLFPAGPDDVKRSK